MFARLTQVQGDPDKVEAGIQSFKDQVLPIAKSVDGFKGATLLVDRSSGKAIGISVWETEEARENADAALREAREKTVREVGSATVPELELYEVAVIEGF